MGFVECQNVSMIYSSPQGGEVHALQNIDLTIDKGDFIALLGTSGCGKTTLLSMVAGFIRPSHGIVMVDGQPVEKPGRDRGVVFQRHALFPWLDVAGNIAFGLKLQRVSKREQAQHVEKYLSLMKLCEFRHHRIDQLSGGMRQRVALARALANDPKMLLMDEPLGGLDAFTCEAMQELMLDLWSVTEKTMFLITHSVEEALFLGTKLIVMSSRPGRIILSRTLDFSQQYLHRRDARGIKSDAAFVAMREQIIDLIQTAPGHIDRDPS